MKLIFLIILYCFILKVSSLNYCDDSCEDIKSESITIYNTNSKLCNEDLPISFSKGNKLIVAFLRNFEKIINSSDKCPSYVLVNLLKKLSYMQKNETQSSLNNQGFKVSNIDTSTSFFSEFYN